MNIKSNTMNANQQMIIELCTQKRKLRVALTVVSYLLIRNTQNPIAIIKMSEHLADLYRRKEAVIGQIMALAC